MGSENNHNQFGKQSRLNISKLVEVGEIERLPVDPGPEVVDPVGQAVHAMVATLLLG